MACENACMTKCGVGSKKGGRPLLKPVDEGGGGG